VLVGMTILAESSLSGGASEVWQYFSTGGFFMLCIAACSLVAMAVIVFKFLTISRQKIVPRALEREVEEVEAYLDDGRLEELSQHMDRNESALSRLCQVALSNAGRTQGEVTEAVQSSAREEIVKMNSGMPVLEVVITIAPLLGLLGTASGLVIVFSGLDESGADSGEVARGIGVALYTTIAGLAVAVPSVIAHSFFGRKIETMAARLEVIMGKVVSACHQHVFFKKKS